MIHHVHSLISSETNTSSTGQNNRAALSQAKLDSFHGALSDAVSNTLEKFGIHPSEVKISIAPAVASSTIAQPTSPATPIPTASAPGSGRSAATSSPAASTTPSATSSSAASSTTTSSDSTSSGAPNNGYDPFLQAAYSNPFPSTSTTTTPAATSSTPAAAPNATQAAADDEEAFDNAYWAAQPTAVQALRNIQDPGERATMATQLASEGYSIDVPIMVWGWDPSITTSMRQADGYTWVPSALQGPVEMAPGLGSMGGIPAYNPNNPPVGSIAV
jgi:hypothetical protein